MISRAFALALTLALALPAQADEIGDAIQRALDAYTSGDTATAAEELAYASQQLSTMKADKLSAFLPEAPDGWTRTVNTDMSAGLQIMGGGVGAEASYSGPESSFTITLMADNPMVASMGAMLASGFAGKITRVGPEKFVDQEGTLAALVGNRVLVQAQGAANEVMIPVLEGMDFKGLETFGS